MSISVALKGMRFKPFALSIFTVVKRAEVIWRSTSKR